MSNGYYLSDVKRLKKEAVRPDANQMTMTGYARKKSGKPPISCLSQWVILHCIAFFTDK